MRSRLEWLPANGCEADDERVEAVAARSVAADEDLEYQWCAGWQGTSARELA
jgi:hypothetical protein